MSLCNVSLCSNNDKKLNARHPPLLLTVNVMTPLLLLLLLLLVWLSWLQVTCSRGSPKRQILLEKRGHFQVPYLEDPNTGERCTVMLHCMLISQACV
jgi:hypothetical protein